MNRTALCLLFIVSLSSASIIYTADIDRAGLCSVTVSLEGEESTSVYVPPDATAFRIVGGTYSVRNETAHIESGKTGFATFSFSTDSLTTKTASGWSAVVFPPAVSEVSVFMPPYSSISNVTPPPKRLSSEDSRISVELNNAEKVVIRYSLLPVPPPTVEEAFPWLYMIVVAAVVLAAVVYTLFIRKKHEQAPEERKPSLDITKGKREMMGTFNENDLRIVEFLISRGGSSRRNELERNTGISKSSLAMALRRLEKRKIVEMDRTATTHYVKLSDHFLSL